MAEGEGKMATEESSSPDATKADGGKLVGGGGGGGVLANLIRNQQNKNFFESLFSKKKRVDDESVLFIPKPISFLSPIANSVVTRCSKILQIQTEELQQLFKTTLPDNFKQPSNYARNLLEFCSYQALNVVTANPEYLGDKDFRRFTYDMMLAWENPSAEIDSLITEAADKSSNKEVEGEDGWSLFSSSTTSMSVQVDEKQTVGSEAFARIAPACVVIADVITAHNLFDAMTSASEHRLHFLIYDKYLRMLEKVIKVVKNATGLQTTSSLQLLKDEIILEVDGTVPTQPVLQHIGMSAWPGRLTLTTHALYFESLGVGLYEKATRYDLKTELKQIIRPELTGPLGARVFDKAVMYKSTSTLEPVYMEFPEFKGNSRRDYWLDICLEILYAHKFIRKYNLEGIQQSEAIARAILGIFRFRAVREAFRVSSSKYKSLLCFNLAESLPEGDKILETLSRRLELLSSTTNEKACMKLPASLLSLRRFKIIVSNEQQQYEGDDQCIEPIGDVCVGEVNPLEMAVRQGKENIGREEAAQATVDQVKVEGIDMNLAVMKELLYPLIESFNRVQQLATWRDPWKSTVFAVLVSYGIVRGWIRYALPLLFVFVAVVMLVRKYVHKEKQIEALKITVPPNKNAVEQLLILQESIAQVETHIQTANVILLKLRALIFAALPQATDKICAVLALMAVILVLVPFKYFVVMGFIEAFTRETSMRQDSMDKWQRRMKEWWFRIPAAPVELIRLDDKKRK
ncbi:uncharacterized protein LOC124911912 [Impatiens glandulifera]|uniref:uncharacterized protein LOC124911912 n=1 Tax=Impatiens glandulifera TaxID=253017 RepID=UPI001FB0E5CE|nr:uncharacterized protein LOC124911912 [Impatiens glandulifera]